jgi:hypothetical protein
MGMILVAFAVNLYMAYLANGMAFRRGCSTKLWVWLAALFGIFAVIPLKFLPPIQSSYVHGR